jgi:hypothetical protein
LLYAIFSNIRFIAAIVVEETEIPKKKNLVNSGCSEIINIKIQCTVILLNNNVPVTISLK